MERLTEKQLTELEIEVTRRARQARLLSGDSMLFESILLVIKELRDVGRFGDARAHLPARRAGFA